MVIKPAVIIETPCVITSTDELQSIIRGRKAFRRLYGGNLDKETDE